MKNNKGRIDTYNTIYHVDIVVANLYVKLELILKLYTYPDGKELTDSILEGCCITAMVNRKKDNKTCILVKFNRYSGWTGISKDLDIINTISHEAGHVALDIYLYMDLDLCQCSTEPFCYLVGYAGECIYKTLKNK